MLGFLIIAAAGWAGGKAAGAVVGGAVDVVEKATDAAGAVTTTVTVYGRTVTVRTASAYRALRAGDAALTALAAVEGFDEEGRRWLAALLFEGLMGAVAEQRDLLAPLLQPLPLPNGSVMSLPPAGVEAVRRHVAARGAEVEVARQMARVVRASAQKT